VTAWYVELSHRRAAGLLRADEIVPAAQTVLLDGVADTSRVAEELAALAASPPSGRKPATLGSDALSIVEIPTVYDGPDLDDVARMWDTDRDGVVAIHAGTEFSVAFCGFVPGFAYLAGLPERYHVPRRAAPRERVAAGTVALASEYCGIYPAASPGGWQCLGRTDVRLFDLEADPPSLLTPGMRVRFSPVAIR
jgi:KipI family sensor histidine kinase inhibitor